MFVFKNDTYELNENNTNNDKDFIDVILEKSKLARFIYDFTDSMANHHVGAYATQAAFFTILSIFPFISLLLSLVKYTPLSKDFLVQTIEEVFPSILQPLMNTILDEVFTNTSGTAFSITVIFAIWSAGKGILSLIYGLQNVYEIEEDRNYFIIRLIATIYTFILAIAIVITLTLLVFGNNIYNMLKKPLPVVYELFGMFIEQKGIIAFLFLTLLFLILYRIIPRQHYSTYGLLPGACFSSAGWIVFSYGFSIYLSYSDSMTYTYGSLTTIVIAMLWIYTCMYILFIGAEINISLHSFFVRIKHFIKKLFKRI